MTFPAGGGNTATINVQAIAGGLAHFSYASPQVVSPSVTTISVSQPNLHSLVAEWNFDAQTLADSVNFPAAGIHDGQAFGSVAFVPGRTGGYALDLTAGNSAIVIKNSKISDSSYRNTFDQFLYGSTEGFSLAFWVKAPYFDSDWHDWIAKDGEAQGYTVRTVGTDGHVVSTLRQSNGPDDVDTIPGLVNDGLWHHLAALYDRQNGQRLLYVDGILQLTIPGDDGLTNPPTTCRSFSVRVIPPVIIDSVGSTWMTFESMTG